MCKTSREKMKKSHFHSRSSNLKVIPKGVPELECLTNITLSSVMQQLSSLARHAEDIFGELYNEANVLYKKSCMLQGRIDVLVVKVTRLDAINDKETLEGFMNQTPYQNTFITDQIILGIDTLPIALKEARSRCDKVPPLGNLDQYREDGKEALKFYTNPGYFFDVWCEDISKNITEDHRRRRQERRRQRRNRRNSNKPTPLKTRKDQFRHMAAGLELSNEPKDRAIQSLNLGDAVVDRRQSPVPNEDYVNDKRQPQPTDPDRRQSHNADDIQQSHGAGHHEYSLSPEGGHENKRHSHSRPDKKAPARPLSPPSPQPITNYSNNSYENRLSKHSMEDPRMSQYGNLHIIPECNPSSSPTQHVPGMLNLNHSCQHRPMPVDPNMSPPSTKKPLSDFPAASPPPSPGGVGQPMASTPAAHEPSNKMSQLPSPRHEDGRSDLLKAIRSGMILRNVQVNENTDNRQAMSANSVEAILQRRLEALQLSDTDSDSSNSWSSSSD